MIFTCSLCVKHVIIVSFLSSMSASHTINHSNASYFLSFLLLATILTNACRTCTKISFLNTSGFSTTSHLCQENLLLLAMLFFSCCFQYILQPVSVQDTKPGNKLACTSPRRNKSKSVSYPFRKPSSTLTICNFLRVSFTSLLERLRLWTLSYPRSSKEVSRVGCLRDLHTPHSHCFKRPHKERLIYSVLTITLAFLFEAQIAIPVWISHSAQFLAGQHILKGTNEHNAFDSILSTKVL